MTEQEAFAAIEHVTEGREQGMSETENTHILRSIRIWVICTSVAVCFCLGRSMSLLSDIAASLETIASQPTTQEPQQ